VAAAEVIAAGHARSIDLARVAETYVAAVLATGFDALVNRRPTNALAARLDAIRACCHG
jgi:diacylglycerol kinase family enzyme